jgi:hypothetical protein
MVPSRTVASDHERAASAEDFMTWVGDAPLSPRALPRAVVAPVVTLALALLAVLSGCREKESPEARIRLALDSGVAALEARDLEGATAVLDDDYQDKAGRTKKKLKQLAFFAMQQGPVLVSLQSVDVQVAGDAATVALKALAVQGSSELKTARDLLPTNARSFDLTISMVKRGKDWKVAAIEGLGGLGGGAYAGGD